MAGRRSKLNAEVVDKLSDLLSQGHFIKTSCQAVGITESTFFEWMKRPEFALKMCEAVTVAEREAMERILAAGKRGDWRADQFFLQHRYSQRWSQKMQINLGSPDLQQKLLKNLTDAELLELVSVLEAKEDNEHDI